MIKKKVKIGLLLNIERSFLDWEIKLFEELLDSKFCEIKLIISEKDNFHSSYKIRSLLVRLINKFINIIERKFTSKRLRLKERLVKKRLRRIQLLNIKVKKKDIYDYIEKKDLKKIKKINLDLIFRRDLGIIKGDLLRVARYGVWSLHHGDNEFYRGQPAGFWECFHNDETTGVTLQKLNNILDGGDVIEKGIYGTKFFWKHNENFIKEKSVTVLLKGIAKLYYQRNIKLMKNKTKKSFRYYRYPNFIILFLYVMKKYPRFIWKKYFWKTFFQKKWEIHLIKSKKLTTKGLTDSQKIIPLPNQYWADPFLISEMGKKFIFFENFDLKKKRGKISCSELKNEKVENPQDIIVKNYHLSYPNVFKFKKEFFMIPETSKNNQVEIWKAVSFPYKWKKFKIIFQNESWADINFLNDRKGNFWLFGSKSMDSFDDHNSELYIYKVEGKFFNKIIPHKKNPVIIDSRIARNAGKIFFNHKSEMIRPSQKNVREDYGYGLNFGKITKLNLNDYEEKNLKSFDLSNNVSFSGIHHFDINNRIILIDKLKNN